LWTAISAKNLFGISTSWKYLGIQSLQKIFSGAQIKCKVAAAQLAQAQAECDARVTELQTQLGAAPGVRCNAATNSNRNRFCEVIPNTHCSSPSQKQKAKIRVKRQAIFSLFIRPRKNLCQICSTT
jgi:hypothetical protein